MNDDKSFFDTNVLLYMHTAAEPRKRTIAQQLFEECLASGRLVISTQVVQEFHSVGARKLGLPMDQMRLLTTGLLDLPTVEIAAIHIHMALEYEEQYQVSFWDALILAAANWADVPILYTEDLNDGQLYGSVRVVNPFHETKD
jgi:predicted nucleic acid-binding protein